MEPPHILSDHFFYSNKYIILTIDADQGCASPACMVSVNIPIVVNVELACKLNTL